MASESSSLTDDSRQNVKLTNKKIFVHKTISVLLFFFFVAWEEVKLVNNGGVYCDYWQRCKQNHKNYGNLKIKTIDCICSFCRIHHNSLRQLTWTKNLNCSIAFTLHSMLLKRNAAEHWRPKTHETCTLDFSIPPNIIKCKSQNSVKFPQRCASTAELQIINILQIWLRDE